MGDYTRIKRLGAGGFGEVWLARHVALNVLHAVKFVHPSKVIAPSDFYKEPKLLKSLEHRNIVQVHDAGFVSGELYIAMEYVRAGSVESYSANQPIKLRRIKPIFCEALKGLQFVHDKGYLHRDIKPANILIGSNGGGKLADFGLAIPQKDALLAGPAGTLTYMAPEILAIGKTTRLTDIYAMGVSLYEAVNGFGYFPAVSKSTKLANQILAGEFPDRSYHRIFVPRALKMIINRAMNPDPAKRYQTADELRLALEATKIRCSWREKTSGGITTWTTSDQTRTVTLTIRPVATEWQLETRHGGHKGGALRKVNRLCGIFPREQNVKRRVAEITQALVQGQEIADL